MFFLDGTTYSPCHHCHCHRWRFAWLALLGLACIYWQNFHCLAKLTLLDLRQRHGQVADALACAARSQPRAKMGGGRGSRFAWLALGLGCIPVGRLRGGSVALTLLGLVCLA
jgi:hypothetical protein